MATTTENPTLPPPMPKLADALRAMAKTRVARAAQNALELAAKLEEVLQEFIDQTDETEWVRALERVGVTLQGDTAETFESIDEGVRKLTTHAMGFMWVCRTFQEVFDADLGLFMLPKARR